MRLWNVLRSCLGMHKKKGRRGRPKVKCSPRNERFPWSGDAGPKQRVEVVPNAQDGGVPGEGGGADGGQGESETDLTVKRRQAAKVRWDAAKIRKLEILKEQEFDMMTVSDEEVDSTSEEAVDNIDAVIENNDKIPRT